MKLCNTVDRISAYDSQTSHMNLSVIDHCHLADFFLITRVLLSYLDQEAAVDLFYDLIDTRKKSGEQVNRPFFKCLCHNRMVRVCTGLCRNLPCLIPAKAFHIHQNSHQLRNSYGRVGIIQLEGNLLIELMDIIMLSHVLLYSFLYGCRDEEILLLQTQLLTCIVIVVGVQNLYDVTCQVLLLYRLLVIALIKGIQLEALYRLRIPDTQGVYNAIAITHDGEIKRNRLNGLIALLGKYVSAILVGVYADITAELYDLGVFGSAQFKRIAVHQPVIGNLYLITVADLLLEHTITITDTAAI